jgi:hypothetical protein
LSKHLHIVTWDIPWPANYGGAIDVFHKLKALHNAGVSVTLHCFSYGSRRSVAQELSTLCDNVYVYQRATYAKFLFAKEPYIVISRKHDDLLKNLMRDSSPILFEGIHCTGWIHWPELQQRKKILRIHNIESNYYWHLWKSEPQGLKKIYFKQEFERLVRYEDQLSTVDIFVSMTSSDSEYFQHKYPDAQHCEIPPFHGQSSTILPDTTASKEQPSYCLYHGNLSISENDASAQWLVANVFSGQSFDLKIAGRNPSKALIRLADQYANVQIIKSPDDDTLSNLITNAKIQCLYTVQNTGMKLKLLNALSLGTFAICNQLMLHGTQIRRSIDIADEPADWISKIHLLLEKKYTPELQAARELDLNYYDDAINVSKLLKYI